MTLLLGGGSRPGLSLSAALDDLLRKSGASCQTKIGCPFVSEAGLELLIGQLPASSHWAKSNKRWLVGVHHGITEPAALRTILNTTKSQSRLFVNGRPLAARSLSLSPTFHAKIVGVERSGPGGHVLEGVVVSSANLTKAALGTNSLSTNFEAGALVNVVDAAANASWTSWWNNAWGQGIPLSEKVIDRYEALRERFLADNPAIILLVDPPSTKALTSSPALWIDAGAMSGGSRNQVEFNRDLAAFFGPPSSVSKLLTVRGGKKTWNNRPLTPKVTTFGVEIWRFSLPTAAAGGPPYAGNVIRLERDASPNTYQLKVAPAGSATARAWRREASRQGYVGRTSGNRDFGLS